VSNATSPFGAVDYVRDALGREGHREVVGQPGVDYTYDRVGNLLGALMPQASVSYVYDAVNRPTGANRLNGVSSQYIYDEVGRVRDIKHARGTTVLDDQIYSYDSMGNRTSGQRNIAQAVITPPATAAYDNGNRLIQRGSTTYVYDDNGNLISESSPAGTTSYSWDSRNRLKSIFAANGQTTSFTYDFSGNLISQAESGPALNLTRTFVVDEFTNVVLESASTGDRFSVLTGQSVDSHLATVRANGAEYALTDAINSTVATVDQVGAFKGRFLYEPFGETAAAGSDFPFQFTGRVPVTASLYYYRTRFYDNQTGRFISEDRLGPIGQNPYAYVDGNPISDIDPYGLIGTKKLLEGAGLLVGGGIIVAGASVAAAGAATTGVALTSAAALTVGLSMTTFGLMNGAAGLANVEDVPTSLISAAGNSLFPNHSDAVSVVDTAVGILAGGVGAVFGDLPEGIEFLARVLDSIDIHRLLLNNVRFGQFCKIKR
jgi:RHS repeat-associated protein